MLSFRCGQCGKGLAVGDELAGKPVRCPGCNKIVTAPQPAKVAVPNNAAPSKLGLTSLGDSARPGDTPSASAVEVTRNDTVVLDEDARKRFESAWRAGTPVTIEKFLTDQRLSHFLATVEELVHIDIEFHWKTWSESAVASGTGRPAAVESYLTRFPQLKRADILQRLVETEFRVRQRLGDKPAAADYRARFPSLKLARLDPQAGPDVTGFLAPAQKPDELGRLGPYRVLEILGRGGMGVVFKAEDTLLQRMVALKAMLPALAGSPTAKERFIREARAAASLKHPHIVTIHQVGEDRGAPFLAMEFLEGESLDDRLKREKKLPIAEVLRIGIEVAEGLTCAHDKGLIHRDIKPANIWLETKDEGGRMKDEKEKVGSSSFRLHPSSFSAKILDFGLARALAEQTQLTQSGAIVGTPAYMAPEQAGGRHVDHRADLFSLGCVLYRACTGEMPFKGGDTMSILSAIALQMPTPPAERNPEVTQGLSEVIMALLAKEASDRPATAREVAQMLREFAADGNDTALLRFETSKKSAPAQPRLPLGPRLQALQALAIRKKKPLLWGSAAVLAMLLVFGLASRERERPENGTNGGDGNSAIVNPPNNAGPSAYDQLRRADIDPYELKIAGSGDPAKAAPELVAIFGDSRLRHGCLPRWGTYDWGGSATFSPKGDRLASVDADGMIRIWEARSGQQLHVLEVAGRWPRFDFTCAYLFFSPDGANLSFLSDGVVRTWNMASGGVQDLPIRHTGALVLQMSKDNKTIATQGGDGRIIVWDPSAGKPRVSLAGDRFWTGGAKHNMEATACALSPDGKRLAFVKENTIHIWNIPDNRSEQTLPGKLTRGFLTFSADGKFLGIPEGTHHPCRVWNLESKREAKGPACLSMALSPDGRFLAAKGELWDIALGKAHLAQQPYRDWMAFSPQGQHFASTLCYRSIKIRDLLGNDQCPDRKDESLIVHGAVTSKEIIMFVDDSPGGQLRFWDLQLRRARMLPTNIQSVYSFQPSPDGKKLALRQGFGVLTVLDGLTGATLHTVRPPAGFATEGECSCVNADCSLAVTCGPKGIMLWDLQKKRQRQLPIPLGGVKFAFTADSKLLAGNGERLSIWDLERDQLVADFRLPRALLWGEHSLMRASPDSTLLGVGLAETVYLVDMATGEITKEFPKQDLLAFSPDGKRLATTGGSTLSIWDPKSGTRERQIDLGLGQVPAFLDYAPDGRHIVVGNANGTVLVLRPGERRE